MHLQVPAVIEVEFPVDHKNEGVPFVRVEYRTSLAWDPILDVDKHFNLGQHEEVGREPEEGEEVRPVLPCATPSCWDNGRTRPHLLGTFYHIPGLLIVLCIKHSIEMKGIGRDIIVQYALAIHLRPSGKI